jgi:hypothetical protein
MVRRICPRASPAAILGSGRRGAAAAAMFLGIVFAVVPFGTRNVSAADALTATDWQYLKSIGYEEHSDALDKATKGQRRYLHKLINKPRIGTKLKTDLINSYLMAIGIGTLPK